MDEATETPEEEKRRKNRERKQKQRAAEKEHLKKVGAKTHRFTIFSGTQKALDELTEFNDCEEWQEVTTLLIHNAAKLIKRDPSQLEELLKPDRSQKGKEC